MVWALTATLTLAILATCLPVAAEHTCECCTSEGLEIGDFTVAKVITVPAPSALVVLHVPATVPLDPIPGVSHYALRHSSRVTPPGVPRYLLATSLLI